MSIDDLKKKIEEYRAFLKKQDGAECLMGESGPVGMSLIDALTAVIEAQNTRVDGLERRLALVEARTKHS